MTRSTPSLFAMLVMIPFIHILAGCHDGADIPPLEPRTVVTGLPDAENQTVTRDGRLFVSAADGLYEITRNEHGAFRKVQHLAGTCQFRGLAEFDGILYGACQDGLTSHLVAVDLDGPSPSRPEPFERYSIHTFREIFFPNGVTVDDVGRLYVNDMINLSPGLGRIVRVEIDPATGRVTDEYVWLDAGLLAPNGMVYTGDGLAVTDLACVKKITMDDDPYRSPLSVDTLACRPSDYLDDLTIHEDGFIVTAFASGSVFAIDAGGELLWEMPPETLPSPSSVSLGRGTGIFPDDTVTVTVIGTLFDHESELGNRLSYFYLP